MEFRGKEKPKNGMRGGFPWWTLLAAFALGVVLTLAIGQSQSQPTIIYRDDNPPDLLLTATALVNGATATARAEEASSAEEIDLLMATATAIIAQATQQGSP